MHHEAIAALILVIMMITVHNVAQNGLGGLKVTLFTISCRRVGGRVGGNWL